MKAKPTYCWQCEYELNEMKETGEIFICPHCLIPCKCFFVCDEGHMHTIEIAYTEMSKHDAMACFKQMRELFPKSSCARRYSQSEFDRIVEKAEKKTQLSIN